MGHNQIMVETKKLIILDQKRKNDYRVDLSPVTPQNIQNTKIGETTLTRGRIRRGGEWLGTNQFESDIPKPMVQKAIKSGPKALKSFLNIFGRVSFVNEA